MKAEGTAAVTFTLPYISCLYLMQQTSVGINWISINWKFHLTSQLGTRRWKQVALAGQESMKDVRNDASLTHTNTVRHYSGVIDSGRLWMPGPNPVAFSSASLPACLPVCLPSPKWSSHPSVKEGAECPNRVHSYTQHSIFNTLSIWRCMHQSSQSKRKTAGLIRIRVCRTNPAYIHKDEEGLNQDQLW